MICRNSLALRHIVASVVLLPVILGFSAYALDKAFRSSLLSAERESLQAQLYVLLGAAEPGDSSLFMPDALPEPRFSIPQSGLYALVHDASASAVWRSESLSLSSIALNIPTLPGIDSGESFFGELSSGGKDYFIFIYNTIWEINGSDHDYKFVIIHSQDSLRTELKAYRATLWRWLGGLTILLIVVQAIVVQWGLNPLHRLANELKRFQDGQTDRLDGDYPAEIKPVTDNLNTVLKSEKQHRLRYKNTLSDLAHSLKTPLAIIRSSLEKDTVDKVDNETRRNIDEQVARMSEIIGHQLRRATNISTNVNQRTTDVHIIVERLGNAMLKVYQDKAITFENRVSKDTTLVGDENDIMELLGNIIENAFKYGKRGVRVSAASEKKILALHIDDDGEGVPSEQQRTIISRGARADTATPGQGLGLAVSVDIISSYGGSLAISRSDMGGARFSVLLPASLHPV